MFPRYKKFPKAPSSAAGLDSSIHEHISFESFIDEQISFESFIDEQISFESFIDEQISFECFIDEQISFECFIDEQISLGRPSPGRTMYMLVFCSDQRENQQQCSSGRTVRDGQTSPHRPRLVVSRSACPPLSPAPHANSFIIGTTVIKKKHWVGI